MPDRATAPTLSVTPSLRVENVLVFFLVARSELNRSGNPVSGWSQARMVVTQPLFIVFSQHSRRTTVTLGQSPPLQRQQKLDVPCWVCLLASVIVSSDPYLAR